jgi:hypothetical protein
VLALTIAANGVHAVPQQLLGKRFVVKANADAPRRILALGAESATDVSVVGDPTTSGGRLRIIIHGATPTETTFVLGAPQWTKTSTGFVYRNASDGVRRVLLKRSPGGAALLKVVIVTMPGGLFDNVLPPNPGEDVSVILTIEGGGEYCFALGGVSGGVEVADTATRWVIRDATVDAGCATVTPTSTTTTSSLGVPPCGTMAASCQPGTFCPNAPFCDGWCPTGSFCDVEYDNGTGVETCVCREGGIPCAAQNELTCLGACPPGLGCVTTFTALFPCSCQ